MLTGIVDLHVHTSPDVRERRLNDIELAKAAKRAGARAVVLKSHVVPTMDRAAIAAHVVPGIRVYGGITLNPQVGGLNAAAVETALAMGAKVVWLPTAYAVNERRRQGKSDGVPVVDDGRAVPELTAILALVARYEVILGTGHLSPAETRVVVEKAKEMGVKKIVITHPEWLTVDMPLEEQKVLSSYGVYFERCYARNAGNDSFEVNFLRNLRAIEAVGYESTVLSSDVGRVENPVWHQAWGEHLRFLSRNGVSREAIDVMTKKNPAALLGL